MPKRQHVQCISISLLYLALLPPALTHSQSPNQASFWGKASGKCVVLAKEPMGSYYNVLGTADVAIRGFATGLTPWYEGGYEAQRESAFGTLTASWHVKGFPPHSISLKLDTTDTWGGWVNSAGHFFVNLDYVGTHQSGPETELISGRADTSFWWPAAPPCGRSSNPLFYVLQLKGDGRASPKEVAFMFIWADQTVTINGGNGCFFSDVGPFGPDYSVAIPEKITLPPAETFRSGIELR